MLEKTNVKKMLNFLNNFPECFAHKTHGSPYSKKGQPDITGCYRGRRFEIEVKAKGKRNNLTKIQRKVLSQWEEAGAYTLVADDLQQVVQFISAIRADLDRGERQ